MFVCSFASKSPCLAAKRTLYEELPFQASCMCHQPSLFPTPGELFAYDFQTEQLVGPLCLTLSLSYTKTHMVLILGRTATCVKVHACSSKYLSSCLKLRKHLSALIKREDPPNWHQRDATVNWFPLRTACIFPKGLILLFFYSTQKLFQSCSKFDRVGIS